MNLSLQMNIEHLIIIGDFELIINHIRRKYKTKNERLILYANRVIHLMNSFISFNIPFFPRERNKKAYSMEVGVSLFNPDDLQS